MKGCLVAFAALAVSGCGSSSEVVGECGSMSGSFLVTERRESGTCPVATDPVTMNVTTNADQTADVSLFDVRCTGTVNACNITGSCPIPDPDVPNIITGNVSLDLTIARDSIRGSYTVTLNPGSPGVPDGCTGTFAVSGPRR